ncbi:triosephosphate isomerase [Sinomonas cyclohexanicum]|uniref:Triosephosphate isomerase n=1 Tax=Sinomonas cyclohexanicum TaxID=322009 RepID=A0ABM7Q0I8_SINCY|nr:triose-phosphate isomerase family protein [Corynebacterium cyclohexanicum]BCT78084.1 triosephosphate isomerase [Corynebacterium cyclohexanicum]
MTEPAPLHRDALHAPIVLGVSLKLYMDVDTTTRWSHAVSDLARAHPAIVQGRVRLFVLPSLPALPAVRDEFEGTPVGVGAQDLFWEDRGAFTGAVSGADLKTVGCAYAEVGHAERRSLFGDDDEAVRRKVAAALRNGLTPVLCVGETAKSHAAAAAAATGDELASAIAALPPTGSGHELIVAYEPRWAIGQAEPAPAEHVAEVIGELRARLAADGRIRSASVIYGGSAQPGTLSTLAGTADGLFLGRFAHDPGRLALIVDEADALSDPQVTTR